MASAVVTPSEYRRYLNLAAEERLVSLATLTEDLVADEIEITDEQVQAYYDANPNMFQLPESADVQYIRISREDVGEGVDISEQTLAQYYEDEKYRYLQDEQRRARHILIQFGDDEDAARAQAEELLTRIRSGDSFEALEKHYAEEHGGDLRARYEALGIDPAHGVLRMSLVHYTHEAEVSRLIAALEAFLSVSTEEEARFDELGMVFWRAVTQLEHAEWLLAQHRGDEADRADERPDDLDGLLQAVS